MEQREFPREFLERMEKRLGDSFPAFLSSLSQPARKGLRLNTIKGGEALLSYLPCEEKIPYTDCGYYVPSCFKAGASPLHHAGAVYVQEPSAMAPVCALPLRDGMRVLDLCAAPGGKSLQAAERIGETGLLVSNEIISARASVLLSNVERLGAKNTVVTSCDTSVLADAFPLCFDAVICDAPCSGEGMFRKENDAILMWSPENVARCALRQTEILENAARCVAPSGYLLYSTCTYSREENEENVLAFLCRHPDFSLVMPNAALCAASVPSEGSPEMRLFYPHLTRGEGQFFALMVREGADAPTSPAKKKTKGKDTKGKNGKKYGKADATLRLPTAEEEKIIRAFLADTLRDPSAVGTPVVFRGDLWLLPPAWSFNDCLSVPAEILYAVGVRLGTLRKGRPEPHHQFFSAYGRAFRRICSIAPDSEQVARYLRGETIPCPLDDGWAVLSLLDCPLGGIKVTAHTAKNHYPKGLRAAALVLPKAHETK